MKISGSNSRIWESESWPFPMEMKPRYRMTLKAKAAKTKRLRKSENTFGSLAEFEYFR